MLESHRIHDSDKELILQFAGHLNCGQSHPGSFLNAIMIVYQWSQDMKHHLCTNEIDDRMEEFRQGVWACLDFAHGT